MNFFSPGERLIKKWRNIKDNFTKSEKKQTKLGLSTHFGRRYIYSPHLSFLQMTDATTGTQTNLNEIYKQEDSEVSEKKPTEEVAGESLRCDEDSASRKRKQDIDLSLTEFLNIPSANKTVPIPVAEPNSDRIFFESILPFIKNLTEDQRLELRCEFLSIVKRLRAASAHTSEYRSDDNQCNSAPASRMFDYTAETIAHQQPRYPTPSTHHPSYSHRAQFQHGPPPNDSQLCPSSATFPQSRNVEQYFNLISPSNSISSVGNGEEDNNIEIFNTLK